MSKAKSKELWKRIRAQQEKYLINRRIKRRRQREHQEAIKFQTAKLKTRRLYIQLKSEALCHQKHSLFVHLHEDVQSLRSMQRQNYATLLHRLREERYTLSNLYEDYPMEKRTKAALKKTPFHYHNLYRNLFLFHVHKKHQQLLYNFLRRQRYERMMQLLWHIIELLLLHRENILLGRVQRQKLHPYLSPYDHYPDF